jgi:hypothetical protein
MQSRLFAVGSTAILPDAFAYVRTVETRYRSRRLFQAWFEESLKVSQRRRKLLQCSFDSD